MEKKNPFKPNLPISDVKHPRTFHRHTAGLTKAVHVLSRVKSLAQDQGGARISYFVKLEDLVHCHISDPEAALVVDGEAVGHVEQGFPPGTHQLSCMGELQKSL